MEVAANSQDLIKHVINTIRYKKISPSHNMVLIVIVNNSSMSSYYT